MGRVQNPRTLDSHFPLIIMGACHSTKHASISVAKGTAVSEHTPLNMTPAATPPSSPTYDQQVNTGNVIASVRQDVIVLPASMITLPQADGSMLAIRPEALSIEERQARAIDAKMKRLAQRQSRDDSSSAGAAAAAAATARSAAATA